AGEAVVARTSTDAEGRRAAAAVEAACVAVLAGPVGVAGADPSATVPALAHGVLAVPLAGPDQPFALAAWWPDSDQPGLDAADLLTDAARSLSLAIEREGVAAARLEAASLRRSHAAQR